MEKIFGQKRLQRIILINSSTFQYADIMVDGNTHISGDNSSGKSTFLQIETLFYTGDSSAKALGIGDGKLPFAQYNLKMNNSYIVYEVRRSEEPDDCFIVFLKNSNWPTFHFFDCPYAKEIFFDNNDVAYDNLESVKNAAERLHPDLDMQDIRGRKDYIDILYGWKDGAVGRRRSLEKFSLTTCRGEDRPHEKITVLLKMLLNLGKVQGDVLKEMIVSSMGSTAKPFDVERQQERASQLIREYNCIRSWTNDANMLQKQNQFKKTYELYTKEREAYEQYPGKAKYARNYAEKEIEDFTKEKDEAQADYDAYMVGIKERREAAKALIDSLKDKRAQLQGEYDKIAPKRKEYASLMSLIPLMEAAEQKKEAYALADQRFKDLSGQSQSLKEKFEAQKTELTSKFGVRKAAVEKEIAEKESDATKRKAKVAEDIEAERSTEETRHKEKSALLVSKKDSLVDLINKANLEIERLKASHPKEEELNRLSEKEKGLYNEIRQLDADINALKQDIRNIENDKKGIPASIRLEHSDTIHEKENDLKEAEKNRDELIGKLATFGGSLAEWLSKNYKGWNKTLGKVLSEDVLFHQHLSPEKDPTGADSVYGIKLDLSQLSPTETDPALLQERLDNARIVCENADTALSDEKNLVEKLIREKTESLDKSIEASRGQIASKTETMNAKSNVRDTILAQIGSVTDEEKRIIDAAVSKKNSEIDANNKMLNDAKADIKAEDASYGDFCKNLKDRKDKLQKEIQDSFDAFKKEKKDALKADKEQLDKDLKQIDDDLAMALSESGIDADRIKALQNEIAILKKQVDTITANELLYHDYKKDKAAYFDHESEWDASIKSLGETISKHEKDEQEKVAAEERVAAEKNSIVEGIKADIEEDLRKVSTVDQYYSENRKEDYEKAEPIESDDTADSIVESDKGAKGRMEGQVNILNLCWSVFKNNLKDYGIKQFFPASAACQDIGEDLRAQKDVYEFITENVILEHCKAWNTAVVPFVSGISYQATEYQTDIKKVRDTVNGINRLFREYNFTDVIKRIELSVEDVGSDLIALIKRSIEISEDYCGENAADRDFLDGSSMNKKFISFIQDIASNLAKSNSQIINIGDMFTLYIEVDEGLNRYGRRRDIKDMGSNGIDTIFKNLLYLLLLTSIRKRFAGEGQSFMLHCPVDEQATLSASNFNSLMSLANRMGVYILANSPDLPSGTEESFRRAYTFWKRPGSEFTNSFPTLTFNPINDSDERERES